MENSFLLQARAGRNQWWRYVLTLLLVGAAVVVASQLFRRGLRPVLGPLFPTPAARELLAFGAGALVFGAVLAALALGLRWLHGRKLASVIAAPGQFRPQEYLFGVVSWGVILAVLALLSEHAKISAFAAHFNAAAFVPKAAALFAFLAIQTTVEELIFRGYLLQGLALRLRPLVWPVLLSSGLFGVAHMGYGLHSLVESFAFGVTFAVLTLRRQNVAFAAGAHFINNFFILLVLEDFAAVSRAAFDPHIKWGELALTLAGFGLLLAVGGRWRAAMPPVALATAPASVVEESRAGVAGLR